MTLPAAPLHMGALHPVEQLLVLAVAFGPFLVLFVVVYVARKRAIAEEAQEAQEARTAQDADGARGAQEVDGNDRSG